MNLGFCRAWKNRAEVAAVGRRRFRVQTAPVSRRNDSRSSCRERVASTQAPVERRTGRRERWDSRGLFREEAFKSGGNRKRRTRIGFREGHDNVLDINEARAPSSVNASSVTHPNAAVRCRRPAAVPPGHGLIPNHDHFNPV